MLEFAKVASQRQAEHAKKIVCVVSFSCVLSGMHVVSKAYLAVIFRLKYKRKKKKTVRTTIS